MDKRIEYCEAAIEFAGHDLLAPLTNVTVHRITTFDEAALKCPGIPSLLIHKPTPSPGNKDDDGAINVITFDTEFYHYKYDVRTIKSEPMLYKESRSK